MHKPSRLPGFSRQGGAFSLGIGGALVALIVAVAIGAVGAFHYTSAQVAAAELRATSAESTLKAERDLATKTTANDSVTHAQLVAYQVQAKNSKEKLDVALRKSADCRLSADVGGVLRSSTDVPGSAGAVARTEGRSPGADPVAGDRAPDQVAAIGGGSGDVNGGVSSSVSCKAIAEWADENIKLMRLNIIQAKGVQNAYEIVRVAREQSARSTF